MLIFLLGVHLGTNYLAVRAVTMRTLNRQRANLAFSLFLSSQTSGIPRKSFPTPDEVSLMERIFERDGVLRWKGAEVLGYCEIGVSMSRIIASCGSEIDILKLLEQLGKDGYIVSLDKGSNTYLVSLGSSSNTITQLHAWMTALCLASGSKKLGIKELEEGLKSSGWDVETGALETRSGTRLVKEDGEKKNA